MRNGQEKKQKKAADRSYTQTARDKLVLKQEYSTSESGSCRYVGFFCRGLNLLALPFGSCHLKEVHYAGYAHADHKGKGTETANHSVST